VNINGNKKPHNFTNPLPINKSKSLTLNKVNIVTKPKITEMSSIMSSNYVIDKLKII